MSQHGTWLGAVSRNRCHVVACASTCRHMCTLATVAGGAVTDCRVAECYPDPKAEELSASVFGGWPVFMSVNAAAWSAIPVRDTESSSSDSSSPPDLSGTTSLVCPLLVDPLAPFWIRGLPRSTCVLLWWSYKYVRGPSSRVGVTPLRELGAWFRQCEWLTEFPFASVSLVQYRVPCFTVQVQS